MAFYASSFPFLASLVLSPAVALPNYRILTNTDAGEQKPGAEIGWLPGSWRLSPKPGDLNASSSTKRS
jgi:hypothetical protein